MADSEDWIKYMTERFVTYVETPREVRRSSKQAAKASREPWISRWFGVAPMGLLLWLRGWRRDRN